jgi:hypothetical protein
MADIAPASFPGVEIIDLDDKSAPADDIETLDVAGDDGLPKHARRQPDGSVILPLLYPVTLRYRTPGATTPTEEHHAELHFRRLTGADMRAVASAPAEDRAVVVIARSAQVKPALMHRLYDRMDAADANAASAVVGFFLGSGRTTGR